MASHHSSSHHASRHPLLGPSLMIECASCPVRETGCADCMVTALLQVAPPTEHGSAPDLHWSVTQTSMPLDQDEWAAVDRLALAGLVSTDEARGARAQSTQSTQSTQSMQSPQTTGWSGSRVASGPHHGDGQVGQRAVG